MSEFKHNVPFLSLSDIESIKNETIIAGGGEGWLLTNREGDQTEAQTVDSLRMFLLNYKAKWQAKVLFDRLSKINQLLVDFQNGNLDKYIDQHDQYSGSSTSPFDPYDELGYYLTTDGIDDLPQTIEVFSELNYFAKTLGIRKKAMSMAFEKIFGDKIEMHYRGTNEAGEEVMVPESEVPADTLAEIKLNSEVREELKAIESDHVFDNYNEWIVRITSMVKDRSPFSEILQLFK